MATRTHSIEVDEAVATALKERADERGMTVPDLVAQYVDEDRTPADGQLLGTVHIASLYYRCSAHLMFSSTASMVRAS